MQRIKASAGEHPVERAIQAGKILPSRRDFYMEKYRKHPDATARVLDKLEPVFDGEYNPEEHEYIKQFAAQPSSPPVAAAPAPYPQGNARRNQPPPTRGSISFEDDQMAREAAAWAARP